MCVSLPLLFCLLSLYFSLPTFPHSLSLAAAQQPLALQIQPLISDLGGCLGEERYWLHVCVCTCTHVCLAVYVGHLRARWHCRGGEFTTGPLLPRYYRGSRFPGKKAVMIMPVHLHLYRANKLPNGLNITHLLLAPHSTSLPCITRPHILPLLSSPPSLISPFRASRSILSSPHLFGK